MVLPAFQVDGDLAHGPVDASGEFLYCVTIIGSVDGQIVPRDGLSHHHQRVGSEDVFTTEHQADGDDGEGFGMLGQRAQGDTRRSCLEPRESRFAVAQPLGKDSDGGTPCQRLVHGPKRVDIGVHRLGVVDSPVHRDRPACPNEPTDFAIGEQRGLGEKPHRPPGSGCDENRIEE